MINNTKHPSFFVVIFSLLCAIFFLITGNAIGQAENPAMVGNAYLLLFSQADSPIATLTADPTGLNFGNVTTATQLDVTIENTGSLATTPGTAVLSNNTEFTIITDNVSNNEILPAGTATITIEFDGTVGVFAETLTIPYDQSVGVPASPLIVTLEADVAPTNVITFTTTAQTVDVDVVAAGATVTWDYADGTSYVGATPPVKDFGSAGIREGNTVTIDPSTALTRINFGTADANVSHISGLTNFANLNYVYAYQNTDLVDMVVTGLANLKQMHLNETGLTPAVFDQIILDMDAAIPGPVTGANMYGDLARTSASDAARLSLIAKGFVWNGN